MKKSWPLNLIVGCFLLIMAVAALLPPKKGVAEDTVCVLIFCSAFMVLGTFFTVLLCRHQARRRRRISRALIFPTALAVTVLTMFSGLLVFYGTRVFTADFFTAEFWAIVWQSPGLWFGLWLLGLVVSLFVAWGVVEFYQRQGQRDDSLSPGILPDVVPREGKADSRASRPRS